MSEEAKGLTCVVVILVLFAVAAIVTMGSAMQQGFIDAGRCPICGTAHHRIEGVNEQVLQDAIETAIGRSRDGMFSEDEFIGGCLDVVKRVVDDGLEPTAQKRGGG